jgi:hypothetical protein
MDVTGHSGKSEKDAITLVTCVGGGASRRGDDLG